MFFRPKPWVTIIAHFTILQLLKLYGIFVMLHIPLSFPLVSCGPPKSSPLSYTSSSTSLSFFLLFPFLLHYITHTRMPSSLPFHIFSSLLLHMYPHTRIHERLELWPWERELVRTRAPRVRNAGVMGEVLFSSISACFPLDFWFESNGCLKFVLISLWSSPWTNRVLFGIVASVWRVVGFLEVDFG